jgi:hypothetical protein
MTLFDHIKVTALSLSLMGFPCVSAEENVTPTQATESKEINPKNPEKDLNESDTPEEKEDATAEKVESEDTIKVARPVTSDPVQVYGWIEKVIVAEMKDTLVAKLDTGAQTSSIHAENQQLFERDGKKWVKFIVTDTREEGAKRYEMEAPLSRIVSIKEPGGESEERNVVRLSFKIGERQIKSEFTLNNRSNMLCPVLIGRTTIKTLGWIDPSRTYLADDKIMR